MSHFFHEYAGLMRDPAHLAVELTLMVLVDGVFLGLAWPALRRTVDRRVQREHAVIDREHGIEHD